MTSVELADATRRFDGATVTATFRVAAGSHAAIVGPSGSGKSTVLRLIAGLETPDSGQVLLNGEVVNHIKPEHRGVGMVAQDPLLFPHQTVGENVGYGLKVRKVARDEIASRVGQALADVRLDGAASRWPHELSGGERQRVALARAMVLSPRYLLADEPLSSLDPPLRRELRETFAQVARSADATTLHVTHHLEDAAAVADTVIVLIDGSVRAAGPTAEVLSTDDAAVAEFLAAPEVQA